MYVILIVFLCWCVFRKCNLPKGLAKEPPKIVKIKNKSDCIHYATVLPIFTCKFDETNTPDVFKHVPDLFGSGFELKSPGKGHIDKTTLKFRRAV